MIHRRVGRLTKLLEIVIVVTVGMQFRVGFGGSEMHVYRKRVARCGWVGKNLKKYHDTVPCY